MVVCVCNRITDRDIARAANGGCPDYETLQADLGVGTRCGCCNDCARSVFAECSCAGGAGEAAPAAAAFACA